MSIEGWNNNNDVIQNTQNTLKEINEELDLLDKANNKLTQQVSELNLILDGLSAEDQSKFSEEITWLKDEMTQLTWDWEIYDQEYESAVRRTNKKVRRQEARDKFNENNPPISDYFANKLNWAWLNVTESWWVTLIDTSNLSYIDNGNGEITNGNLSRLSIQNWESVSNVQTNSDWKY